MKFFYTVFLWILFCPTSIEAQTGIELVSERTMYSKTFVKADGGREQLIAAGPIHYANNGVWETIDVNFQEQGATFVNSTNPLRSSFPKNWLSGNLIEYAHGNSSISFRLEKTLVLYDEISGVQPLAVTPSNVNGQITGNSLVYADVFPGINDAYTVETGAVKHALHLVALPAFLMGESASYFGYSEDLMLPEGWSIEPLVAQNSELIQTTLVVRDANHTEMFHLPAPVFYEAENSSDDGASMVQGAYHIDVNGGNWTLTTLIPLDWLQNPGRTFPVVLDPTVVLSGTNGGWQSQNNAIDNPGFVFIGVCCGNLEHRAWILWNTTSIPDASCVTNVEMQIYVNGVGAATAELVHAYDITGQFGPYGGIVPAAYADMATGWYTSFTLGAAGYYGYYDLGANADALLQSQLPGNLYQVAMIFDNEPSTNWKRLTANMCSLRVTYDDPPCVVLPVGLADLELSCEEEQVLLNWTTATEQNNAYFTIAKSRDGIVFTDLAQVAAVGNSTTPQSYRWLGTSDAGTYYRLSQTDFDGVTTVLGTRFDEACHSDEGRVFVDAQNGIHVVGHSVQSFELRDEMGRLLLTRSMDTPTEEFVFSNPQLSSGIYTAILVLDGGARETVRFVVP